MSDDEFREKLRYWRENPGTMAGHLRRKGTTDTRPVLNENTGRVGGTQTFHWNDRVDAHITPDPIKVRIRSEAT